MQGTFYHFGLRRDFESHCTRRVRAGLVRDLPLVPAALSGAG